MPGKRSTNKLPRNTASRKTQPPKQPKEPRASARAEQRNANKNDPGDLQSLPDDLRCRVDQAIVELPKGLKSVRKIYDHFALKDHSITYQSFLVYARCKGWRGRLAATGQIVQAMFGSSEKEQADHLCNRAYLSLMSTVSRMLQEDEEQFPTVELVRLSKIITDQRAVGVKERDVEIKAAKQAETVSGGEKAKPSATGLPDNFDEIVRRIYGVEIKDEVRSTKDEKGSCPLAMGRDRSPGLGGVKAV